jgi:hypothetical protein
MEESGCNLNWGNIPTFAWRGQDSWSPISGFNQGLPVYGGMLPTPSWRLVQRYPGFEFLFDVFLRSFVIFWIFKNIIYHTFGTYYLQSYCTDLTLITLEENIIEVKYVRGFFFSCCNTECRCVDLREQGWDRLNDNYFRALKILRLHGLKLFYINFINIYDYFSINGAEDMNISNATYS